MLAITTIDFTDLFQDRQKVGLNCNIKGVVFINKDSISSIEVVKINEDFSYFRVVMDNGDGYNTKSVTL